MDPALRLPESLVSSARAFADGSQQPAEPRDASTVVLMRPGSPGIDVYLLRRSRGMAFAGGFCVFPGGGVDPRDFDGTIGWVGPSPEEWAEELGTTREHATALVCAAVRETFEESGVLLAGPTDDSVVGDTTGEDWESDRQRLEAREVAFTDFLAARDLKLRTDLLRWWGSWITPVFEPRRYDTRFFVAELPEGQVTRDVSTESEEVLWIAELDQIASNALDQAGAALSARVRPVYRQLALLNHEGHRRAGSFVHISAEVPQARFNLLPVQAAIEASNLLQRVLVLTHSTGC